MSYGIFRIIKYYIRIQYNSLKFNNGNNGVRSTQILLGIVTHTKQYGIICIWGAKNFEIYYAKYSSYKSEISKNKHFIN